MSKRKAYSSSVLRSVSSSLASIKAIIWVILGTSQNQMHRTDGLPEQTHVVQATYLSGCRTHLFYRTSRMPFSMDLGIACQAETEMPLVLAGVAHELGMDKATRSRAR
jgi:hypothetical protein